jgi:hypothetical protein
MFRSDCVEAALQTADDHVNVRKTVGREGTITTGFAAAKDG